jgi:hypothetical protein
MAVKIDKQEVKENTMKMENDRFKSFKMVKRKGG